ncbi:MAG TPA: hypothetical protein VFP97_10435 [Chitinophagaceae bacterium]|nr:hypothetical protein [Chitinophagaceae bacterium]
MALKTKYQELLTAARALGVLDLQVREETGILYIDALAPSETVKDKLWVLYEKISDHDGREVMMNISVERGNGRPGES